MGEPDPASVRNGPARVSSMWKRDASRELHHRPARGQAHRGPSPQARSGRSPAPTPRACRGQHRLRAVSARACTTQRGGSCRPGPPHRAVTPSRRVVCPVTRSLASSKRSRPSLARLLQAPGGLRAEKEKPMNQDAGPSVHPLGGPRARRRPVKLARESPARLVDWQEPGDWSSDVSFVGSLALRRLLRR